MAKTLEMIFQNSLGRNVRISVADPKDDLTAAQVQAAMDTILAKNIFTTTGGDIIKAQSARIVTREVAEIVPQS